jgi:predicted RNA-binding Zn-ribbon protein involved in translation (DUF1610 family)
MVTADPTLSFDVDVTAGDGRWIRKGNHAIWSGRREASEPAYVLHEWTERGVRPFPRNDDNAHMRRVPAGTPYHIAHLFGFWIVNDVDLLLLNAKRDATDYTMLVVGGRTDGLREASCSFVCPKCAARFGEARFAELPSGYERFIDFALKQVRAFNANTALRTCPQCGAVHPPIYGFHAEADTPEERAAREAG